MLNAHTMNSDTMVLKCKFEYVRVKTLSLITFCSAKSIDCDDLAALNEEDKR